MADSKVVKKLNLTTNVSNSDPHKSVGVGGQVVGISRVSTPQPSTTRQPQAAPGVLVSPPGQRNTPEQHGGLGGGERPAGANGRAPGSTTANKVAAIARGEAGPRFDREQMDLLDHVLGEFARKQAEDGGDPNLANLAKRTYETAIQLRANT